MAQRFRLALIFGGRSSEHDISLLSAASVLHTLDPAKYEVVPIGITKSGKWVVWPGDVERFQERELTDLPKVLPFSMSPPGIVILDGTTPRIQPIDVAFPLLHGPYGEDGTVQGLLELAAIPYVGAGVLASALGMDKAAMKVLFRQAGLPTADFEVVLRKQVQREGDALLDHLERRFGYPCFVKPANLGSSVGITKARNRQQLRASLAVAGRYDRKILIEEFVSGREIECSVLGNDDPIASLPGEIISAREFYDYEAKYSDPRTQLIAPVMLPAKTTAEAQRLAIAAFQAIDCAGMARVDLFLRPDGRLIINEINTIPGFTAVSMYPKLWEASGIPYPDLLDRLIALALERHREAEND